jgi:hypothetical protein
MRERKFFARLMTAAAVLALAGCKIVSDPPKSTVVQDVEFLRGCWVSKTAPGGEITGFLRLLPEGADGLAYQGYVQVISGGEQTTPMHVSFARDGSSMTMRSSRGEPVLPEDESGGVSRPHAPLPRVVAERLPLAGHRATYAFYRGRAESPWVVAEGDDETIAIYFLDNGGEKMSDLFRGERDGCD